MLTARAKRLDFLRVFGIVGALRFEEYECRCRAIVKAEYYTQPEQFSRQHLTAASRHVWLLFKFCIVLNLNNLPVCLRVPSSNGYGMKSV